MSIIVPPLDHAALFRASPGPQLVVDRELVVVDVNDGFLRLARRVRDDVVGRPYLEIFPIDDSGPLTSAISEVFASGESHGPTLIKVALPISLVEGDGTLDALWNVTHVGIRDAEGRISHVAQQIDDVAVLRETLLRADAMTVPPAGRSSESDRLRLLRLFDQSLSFTVFMREPEHVVELANPAYLKMVGEEDLRDLRYGQGHRGEPPVPTRLLDAVYESGIPIIEHGLALRVPDSDNRLHTIYVDVVIQQIVDADGKVIGVFMQGNDVTMAKATQDELAAYRSRLEEMVADRTRALERSEAERRNAEAALHRAQRLEAVGKLTGGVAHDFNNVLQIIRGNLQLMQRHAPTQGELTHRIEAALDGVDRGAKLASQLLAFGRRQPLEPVVVNLGQVLRRMEDLLHRALGESIVIRTDIAPDLWNTLIDVPRLENVILNIAINARDAMNHRGSLTMELRNTTVDEADTTSEGPVAGDFVTLAISDTGSGMSPEVQRRAFEPFFTTKPEGEGTGLGLSMVYGFMKQSGGNVTLASEEGRGTTIRLFMPRSDEAISETVVAPTNAPARGNGETILVVEDDEAVRVTVVETLLELGYRVLRAADGQSALTIIKSGVPIDLLFTDVIMPGPVPSTEMVERARVLLPQMQVLFTSGYTRDTIVDRDRLKAGVNLLSKPYGREDLGRRLRQLFDDRAASLPQNSASFAPPASASHPADSRSPSPKDTTTVNTPGATGTPAPSHARKRVLLVEDSEEVRETTIEFINEVGFDVVAVDSAEAALEKTRDDRFDIVFTDISLPGMNGIELLKRLRETDPGQRVVVASGYGADLGRQGFGERVAVLAKPYDLATLEKTLNHLIDS